MRNITVVVLTKDKPTYEVENGGYFVAATGSSRRQHRDISL